MLHRVLRRRNAILALVVVPSVALLVVLSAAAVSGLGADSGAPDAPSGGAFGESVAIHTIVGAAVTSGPTPTVTLPPGGGGPIRDQLAGVTVPNIISAGLLQVSTEGNSSKVSSSATVANLNLIGGALSADVVKSMCVASESGATASATLGQVSAAGITVPASPAPNTTINVPLIGVLILNEQITSTTNDRTILTVNAIHLKLDSSVLGSGDIIVSDSRCEVPGAGAPTAVVPVGTIGGLGLAALLGALFFWKVLARRPDRSGSVGTA